MLLHLPVHFLDVIVQAIHLFSVTLVPLLLFPQLLAES